jgi:hypothetical protein
MVVPGSTLATLSIFYMTHSPIRCCHFSPPVQQHHCLPPICQPPPLSSLTAAVVCLRQPPWTSSSTAAVNFQLIVLWVSTLALSYIMLPAGRCIVPQRHWQSQGVRGPCFLIFQMHILSMRTWLKIWNFRLHPWKGGSVSCQCTAHVTTSNSCASLKVFIWQIYHWKWWWLMLTVI